VLERGVNDIFVADVISAVDETVDSTRCGGSHNCQDNERCLTHDLWNDLSDRIHDYLSQISLQDLMEQRGAQKVVERQNDRQALQVGLNGLSTSKSRGCGRDDSNYPRRER
jgi:Rrf2 family iron-sulfur cluster assembly transcriptional regulator